MAHRLEEGICCSPFFSRRVDQVFYLGQHLCVRTNLDAWKLVVSSCYHWPHFPPKSGSLDDDSLLYNSSASKDIGEIKIILRRASNLQPPMSAGYNTLPISEKVHERSKKAVAHRVQYV